MRYGNMLAAFEYVRPEDSCSESNRRRLGLVMTYTREPALGMENVVAGTFEVMARWQDENQTDCRFPHMAPPT